MSDSSSGVNPFDALAEEFVARHRRGEKPSVSEYADKYPELADDIRDLFPGLLLMEDVRPQADATGPFSAAPADPRLAQLGDYRIVREVGRGGMGVVYEAEQVSLGRHVALKVLPAHGLMNPTFLERFRREAKAAARLHHTNIVPVYGVGEADGVHFYAMQFIAGQSLDQVLHDLRRLRKHPATAAGDANATGAISVAQGLLTGQFAAPAAPAAELPADTATAPPPAAPEGPRSSTGLSAGGSEAQYYRSVARVGLQVAEALAYAHKQGVLHRDVKPSNLLLDPQGTVWITDFGLAKAEGGDELTATGDVVGTVRFMAPERFEGHSLPQSDIYSLGLTLYELLTLRPAFEDSNKARLIEKVMHEPPVPPRKLDPHIPRDLETIVLKCLAKDVGGRYVTAEAVAEDVRRFLADRPIRARRSSAAERLGRWCRRNPALASLLAAVAVLLIAVATMSVFYAAHLKAATIDLTKALNKAEGAEAQARLREAEALVGKAHGTRYSRRPGQRFEALAALKQAAEIGRELGQPAEWFDTLRNEAIAALALPDIHITHSWDGFPPGTRWAGLSEDFELYARTTDQGDCSVRRVADNVELAHLSELGEPTGVYFGPGRLLILHGESGRWQLWDLAEAEPALRFDQRRSVDTWSFRSGGRLIIQGHRDGSLGVYTTSGVCKHWVAAKDITRAKPPNLHPSEPIVAGTSYFSPWVYLRDLQTGDILTALKPWDDGRSGDCAWSPDGHTLAVTEGDGGRVNLYAYDPASRGVRLTRTLQGPDNGGAAVHFNPAGDRVVTRGWDGRVHMFDPATGRLLFSTHSLPTTAPVRLQFDPSGGRLGAARVGAQQQQIGVWSVADAREYRALVHEGSGPLGGTPAVHPGGRLAALAHPNGLALFDLQTGRELAFIPIPKGCGSAVFDGTGNLLTNGFAGFFRWPVRSNPVRSSQLILGPPERLPFQRGDHDIGASRDGQVLAQAMWNGYNMQDYAGGWVLHPKSAHLHWVEAGSSVWSASVSPDGQWAAFGTPRVNVFEALTGRRVWQCPVEDNHYHCRFSRDGLWLVTGGTDGRAYRVGTWEPGPPLGSGTPFDVSPDSRLVVLGQADGVYRLVELATGREVARLEDPDQIAKNAVFTPDSTRLVVAAEDGLRVWDLRRIRAELTKLGLDWDALPYPEAADAKSGRLEVKVVGSYLANPQKVRARAILDLLRKPLDGDAHFRLGRHLLDEGQPQSAYAFLTVALALRPDLDEARNTRSRAAVFLKRWADAAADASHYLDRHADAAKVRFRRARCYEMARRFAEAIGDWTALIEHNPIDPMLYDSRAACHEALGQAAQARADREQALALVPHDPRMLNNLAWALLTGPADQRDPARALALIEDAVKQQSGTANFLNILGVAQYRNGQHARAIVTLEKSLAAGKGESDAFDLFFLAMCHAKLGNPAKAKECFERAVKWVEAQKNLQPQLAAALKELRAEAEAVLNGPKPAPQK
jgi:serine/threonine protein kinase/WD40 repeat protein/tetratricopeptide (TPR) repeat protein